MKCVLKIILEKESEEKRAEEIMKKAKENGQYVMRKGKVIKITKRVEEK